VASRAACAAGASSLLAGGGGTYQPIRAGVLLSSSVIVDGSRSLLSFREAPVSATPLPGPIVPGASETTLPLTST
jgi:hypothetical protein